MILASADTGKFENLIYGMSHCLGSLMRVTVMLFFLLMF